MILSELPNCLESESQEISSFSLYYANNFKETDKNNKDFFTWAIRESTISVA